MNVHIHDFWEAIRTNFNIACMCTPCNWCFSKTVSLQLRSATPKSHVLKGCLSAWYYSEVGPLKAGLKDRFQVVWDMFFKGTFLLLADHYKVRGFVSSCFSVTICHHKPKVTEPIYYGPNFQKRDSKSSFPVHKVIISSICYSTENLTITNRFTENINLSIL